MSDFKVGDRVQIIGKGGFEKIHANATGTIVKEGPKKRSLDSSLFEVKIDNYKYGSEYDHGDDIQSWRTTHTFFETEMIKL